MSDLLMKDQVEDIRFYDAQELGEAIECFIKNPMMRDMLRYTFPSKGWREIVTICRSCESIQEFQSRVIYHTVSRVMNASAQEITTSGFEKLDRTTSYFYISNHRDIVLDTSLLNITLHDNNQIMTASAIGDNLVQDPGLHNLSKLNRNFLVKRAASPREMLRNSQLLSKYVAYLLHSENRSVWMAQREGRTKDGDDKTQQGLLKMIAFAKAKNQSVSEYLSSLKVVPVAISYELDPTDRLKVPELMAKAVDEEYVKTANEDFNSILKGALGQKKRIHLAAGEPMKFDAIDQNESINEQLQQVANTLDNQIYKQYKLWPSNYVAYDLLNKSTTYSDYYSANEKRQFERRIFRRVDESNPLALKSFLKMYANPLVNKLKLSNG